MLASANEILPNYPGVLSVDLLADKFASDLSDRIIRTLPQHAADFDGATLGKPGHLAIAPSTGHKLNRLANPTQGFREVFRRRRGANIFEMIDHVDAIDSIPNRPNGATLVIFSAI